MKRIAIAIVSVIFFFSGGAYADLPEITIDQAVATLDQSKLRIHFIDVGPGLAVFIQTPNNNKHIFIDGGKKKTNKVGEYTLKFLPKNSSIDLAIVTHADYDHIKGMLKILELYDVKEFWYSGYSSPKLSKLVTWGKLIDELMKESGCKVKTPMNMHYKVGEVENIQNDLDITLLNIDDDPPAKDWLTNRKFDEGQQRNNASLVFKLIYNQVSFLFTGDINGKDKNATNSQNPDLIDSEELELWVRHKIDPSKFSLKSTVLQVAHHGSNGSSSLPFLKAVDPEYAIISAGHDYDHPSEETMERLKKAGLEGDYIIRTDDGDSYPKETDDKVDPEWDDNIIIETDGVKVTGVYRVKMEN